MIQDTPQADEFKKRLRESLEDETRNSRAVELARHANAYTSGDPGDMIYFIQSGQIKLVIISAEGRECLLAIHGAGDVFGETCLSGLGARVDTATAMKATTLKQEKKKGSGITLVTLCHPLSVCRADHRDNIVLTLA